MFYIFQIFALLLHALKLEQFIIIHMCIATLTFKRTEIFIVTFLTIYIFYTVQLSSSSLKIMNSDHEVLL